MKEQVSTTIDVKKGMNKKLCLYFFLVSLS
jgi:hypothetical protein